MHYTIEEWDRLHFDRRMIYLSGLDVLRARELDDLREAVAVGVNSGFAGRMPERAVGTATDRIGASSDDDGAMSLDALRSLGATVVEV